MKRALLVLATGAVLGLGVFPPAGPAPARAADGLRDRVGSHDWGRSRVRQRDWDYRPRDRVRFRSNFGIWIGPGWDPWWWGPSWYYPRPYYEPYPYRYAYPDDYDYYRPPAAPPAQAYEEQVPETAVEPSYWYRCEDPPGYYPYVRDCPGGWSRVPATPEPAAPQAPVPAQPPAAQPGQPQREERPGPVPEEYRWYRCADPEGYYPYVRDCPGGWEAVAPAPPAAR